MISLDLPVIVEGKYDKITLSNIIDTTIITTDGFGIFKNKQKRDYIRAVAKNGVIVMTDSDSAGNVIRAHLKNIIGPAPIYNVYIPKLKGKEKRKSAPSKEGTLGVEGMKPEVILSALEKCGIFASKTEKGRKITKNDLFCQGLSGGENSSEKREDFLKFLGFPGGISSSAMIDLLNSAFSFEEFSVKVKEWQINTDKN